MSFSSNIISTKLNKKPSEFTKADIIDFIKGEGIRHVNFMYPAGDGRLKTLNFVVHDLDYLDEILACGERVDGSSLFSFVEASSSDLYVVPRFKTAFVDPTVEIPTIAFLCSFFNKDGEPLESSPEYVLQKACRAFRETTGMDFEAMGELEYYVIAENENTFPTVNQRGYHESAPFAKFGEFRKLCMQYIAQAGGKIKYGHSEVGNFTLDGKVYEQNEIEFLPGEAMDAAEQLLVAKWIIRNLAHQFGYDVTFAPKITTGKAGSGMHVHMRLMKDGKNVMLDGGGLSDAARKMIAGVLELAPSITAFGNTNPTSYFRLVPHQEAPTNICWGDRNRSTLIRVPLGWTSSANMSAKVNPLEAANNYDTGQKQTVEIRCPDGSANIYLLFASLAVAARYGFEMPNSLEIARNSYVDVNIHRDENRKILESLKALPDSCAASAKCLEKQRAIYESKNVFTPSMIDGIKKGLEAFNDSTLRADIGDNEQAILELVESYFHCG